MERQTILKELQKDGLQILIDRTNEVFRTPFWKRLFDWKYTVELNWTSYLGKVQNSVAATVTSFNAAAPLRTRKTMRKTTGEIPKIQEMFQMDEKDLRTYLQLAQSADADEAELLAIYFDDIKKAAEAPHKRLDMFSLEGLSTGKITIDTSNNPDGMVLEEAVDLGMPVDNKYGTQGEVWNNATGATPITDITKVRDDAMGNGKILTKMYMRRSVFNNMRKSAEVKDAVSFWATGKKTGKVAMTLDYVNEYLQAEGLPVIEIVEIPINIESKDGSVTTVQPFSQYNVAFVAQQKLGKMYHTFSVEKLHKDPIKTYATVDNVLLKQWNQPSPLMEFTACELLAFPAFNEIERIYLLNTNNKTTFS